jgi:MoxR-like ATPase
VDEWKMIKPVRAQFRVFRQEDDKATCNLICTRHFDGMSTPALVDALGALNEILLGKEAQVRLAVCCLLARGHLLIQDIPGVGKTTLAHGLAVTLGLEMRRVQFTSDLLPADIVGNAIFDREKQQFVFHAGPIFSQVVLSDEVNRATPKTQSALLEAMEEGQVTVDGVTHRLPEPFFVIATQNPHHQVGTYPLPESQLDRFLMCLSLGFPDREAERRMLEISDRKTSLRESKALLSAPELIAMQKETARVHIAPSIRDYLLDLLTESRRRPLNGFGLSPRAGLAWQRAAQAWAYLGGRQMVLPEDIQVVAGSVIGHRLGLNIKDTQGSDEVGLLLKSVPAPQ